MECDKQTIYRDSKRKSLNDISMVTFKDWESTSIQEREAQSKVHGSNNVIHYHFPNVLTLINYLFITLISNIKDNNN